MSKSTSGKPSSKTFFYIWGVIFSISSRSSASNSFKSLFDENGVEKKCGPSHRVSYTLKFEGSSKPKNHPKR